MAVFNTGATPPDVVDLAGEVAVTIAAGRDYISVSGQELTLNAVDMTAAADVTGTLPSANGGTGQDLSGSTGALSVSGGTVSAGTLAISNGGTGATTASGALGNIGALASEFTLNAQTGTTYTLVAGDKNKLVTLNNASAITLTVPASVFSAGDVVNLLQLGAGQVTIAAGGGATVNSGPGLAIQAQYGMASVICTAANTFVAVGYLG